MEIDNLPEEREGRTGNGTEPVIVYNASLSEDLPIQVLCGTFTSPTLVHMNRAMDVFGCLEQLRGWGWILLKQGMGGNYGQPGHTFEGSNNRVCVDFLYLNPVCLHLSVCRGDLKDSWSSRRYWTACGH